MPSDSGFQPFLCGEIWWCHSCHKAIGQPSDASRPVCPSCNNGFLEFFLRQGGQSLGIASLGSHWPLSPYLLPSQGSVQGECSGSPGLGQWLPESVDSHYGRRSPTPASNASMDASEVDKVNGRDAATECTICKDQINVGEDVNCLPCGHLYHSSCISQWFEVNKSCPLCRHKMVIGVPDYDRVHSSCGDGVSSSGRRLSSSQTRPFRASMTMSEQAQGETSSRPASNTESVSGFLYDAPGNNFDVDYDGDVIMRDAGS